MKEAILHLGFPKTASSSIQATLGRNSKALASEGLRMARFRNGVRKMNNLNRVFLNIYSRPNLKLDRNVISGAKRDKLVQTFQAQMRTSLQSNMSTIYSAESASGLWIEGLDRIKEEFAAQGWQIRVIAFIRPPSELINSVTQQALKTGLPNVIPKVPLANLLCNRIERIQHVFPDAEFIPFSQCKSYPGGPVAKFADTVRPGLAKKLKNRRRNESMSDNAARLLAHINAQLPFFIDTPERHVNPLRRDLDYFALSLIPGERFRIRTSEMAHFEKELKEENARLERILGPEFCDTDIVPDDTPVVWGAQQVPGLQRALCAARPAFAEAICSYFETLESVPPEISRVLSRYGSGIPRKLAKPAAVSSVWLRRARETVE